MGKHHATMQLLIQPDAGRDAVAKLIGSTSRTLLLKIYSLTDEALVDALLEAGKRRVAVRVMLNSERADHSRDNDVAAARLKDFGIEVRWGSPRLAATHEKSLVLDGERALVASFNFGPKYFEATRDFGIVTRDPAQVAEIAACFEADWEERTFEPSGTTGLLWAPGTARRQVAAAMAGARKTIHLQHAKLVDTTVLLELLTAVRRGVKVRFLCAGGHGLHS
ncbi:MAG: cardiolipin synthase, partial [Gluconacetobacter diazotrophicus]|nr:cardiolipin synthase [Gluconacetobacter diazotrophicus]